MPTGNVRFSLVAGVLLTGLHLEGQSVPAEQPPQKLLRLPGATLLVGDPPRRLFLVTEDKVVALQNNQGAPGFIRPSFSSDGSVVVSGLPTDPPERSPRNVVRTYSVKEKKWTDHQIVIYGGASISSDGSQLAFQADEGRPDRVRILDTKAGEVRTGHVSSKLRILTTKGGQVTILSTPRRTGSIVSWSPDGRRIVLDGVWEPTVDENTFRQVDPSIYVFDVSTGMVARIAEGMAPSSSPSGEWIAYIADAPDSQFTLRAPRFRVRLVRPDGTDARDIMDFGSWVLPNLAPVWSPDSKTLLVNVSNNPDEGTVDIYQVDVETRKRTRKVKGTRHLVFGWVAAK